MLSALFPMFRPIGVYAMSFSLLNHVVAQSKNPGSEIRLASGEYKKNGAPKMKTVATSALPLPMSETELVKYLHDADTKRLENMREPVKATDDGQFNNTHTVTVAMLASAVVACGLIEAEPIPAPAPAPAPAPTDRIGKNGKAKKTALPV
jgi:hypothetical protein